MTSDKHASTGLHEHARRILIRIPYWLGIIADAIWAVALFVPQVFGVLTGRPDFDTDLQLRLVMAVGGILMTGWTFLLLWAVKKPVERRFVIILTAFPVVFGLFIVALVGFLAGNTFQLWILIKTSVLFICMVISYFLAGREARH